MTSTGDDLPVAVGPAPSGPAPSGPAPTGPAPIGPAPAGAWHPDPSGRAHLRWWDGTAWTDRVSSWDQQWVDPPGPDPTRPDLSVLAEPSLGFAYGAGGIESLGRWPIFDPAGRPRGCALVESQGMLGSRRRYLILDPADRVVLVVDPRDGFSPDTDVIDWTGRPHGVFDGQAFSATIRFQVGTAVFGQASAHDAAGASGPFLGDDVDHVQVLLTDATGAPFGALVNHEARRGLKSFFGGQAPPTQMRPEQSWFHLDRSPTLAEPLRTFALAFPLLYAHRVHLARQARRNSHHHHHH